MSQRPTSPLDSVAALAGGSVGGTHTTAAHDGDRRQAPHRLDEWWLERVALESPGHVERMSDAPPALVSILAAMVAEIVEYERQEVVTDGT